MLITPFLAVVVAVVSAAIVCIIGIIARRMVIRRRGGEILQDIGSLVRHPNPLCFTPP